MVMSDGLSGQIAIKPVVILISRGWFLLGEVLSKYINIVQL